MDGKEVLAVVGSGNPVKISSVKNVMEQVFRGRQSLRVESCLANSRVPRQPKEIEQIVSGARNRAMAAYTYRCAVVQKSCQNNVVVLGVGTEAGVYSSANIGVPGYVHVDYACIYDGVRYTFGGGPSFQVPQKFVECIVSEERSVRDALHLHCRVDETTSVGCGKGIEEYLSCGKIDRGKSIELAVLVALMPFMNRELYDFI